MVRAYTVIPAGGLGTRLAVSVPLDFYKIFEPFKCSPPFKDQRPPYAENNSLIKDQQTKTT